jgi:hypothetical protein
MPVIEQCRPAPGTLPFRANRNERQMVMVVRSGMDRGGLHTENPDSSCTARAHGVLEHRGKVRILGMGRYIDWKPQRRRRSVVGQVDLPVGVGLLNKWPKEGRVLSFSLAFVREEPATYRIVEEAVDRILTTSSTSDLPDRTTVTFDILHHTFRVAPANWPREPLATATVVRIGSFVKFASRMIVSETFHRAPAPCEIAPFRQVRDPSCDATAT